MQVSGGDQQSYQGETGPGAERGPTGGAQRQPSPGQQPSGRVGRLRPEPVRLCRPDAQWRTDCTRRDLMDELIFPSFPIISSPLLLSLFNQSTHHPVFGNFHRIKLTLSCVVCLCVHCRIMGSRSTQVLTDMETLDWFSKYFHTFEVGLRLLKLSHLQYG